MGPITLANAHLCSLGPFEQILEVLKVFVVVSALESSQVAELAVVEARAELVFVVESFFRSLIASLLQASAFL